MLAPLLLTTLASVAAHAQDETATYTITFEGLWTVDDITDAAMPSGAHFTQVIGATHNSDTTIWVSGGMASTGVEDVAELGVVSDLIGEIGQNANADAVVRAGSSFNRPTQTVSSAFTVNASHPPGLGRTPRADRRACCASSTAQPSPGRWRSTPWTMPAPAPDRPPSH